MTTTAPLRPFFGFYGGKWRDSPRHYPPPAHTRIIEPFAGPPATRSETHTSR